MIILLLLAVVAFSSWLIRTHMPDTFRRSPAADAPARQQTPAACCALPDDTPSDTDIEARAWTALDDHQLNRLLKESSP